MSVKEGKAKDVQKIASPKKDDSSVELLCKWQKKSFTLKLSKEHTIGKVRQMLADLTQVQPKRQKLIGLRLHKKKEHSSSSSESSSSSTTSISDNTKLAALSLRGGRKTKFMMVGVPEAEAVVDKDEKDLPEVLNDLDQDFNYDIEEALILKNAPENIAKMKEVAGQLTINIMNKPRKDKPLLVMDLDYTLFDMKSSAENFNELKRPFSDHFLKELYPYYDIIFWSQTSWKWLEIKLTELGFLTHPDYKICFVLDKTCMFSVSSMRKGRVRKHQVKSLGIIWSKFPQWSAKNTVHVDDLGRNFVMNPQSGLKIKAYKKAYKNRQILI